MRVTLAVGRHERLHWRVAPSAKQITAACEGLFVLEDWHNVGPDYDTTLMHWHKNYTAHWDTPRARYDERFRRMWTYYLLSCAGMFRARYKQLWQIVLSPKGVVPHNDQRRIRTL